MLHTKFHVSEPNGSDEEDFPFFFVFLWFKPRRPLGRNHFGPKDLHLNKGDKRQLGHNATCQGLSICANRF